MTAPSIPVIGLCAFSGTGKTTLLTQLLPILTDSGLRVGIVKHAHHSFDIDRPGKDSYECRKAGASQVAVASRHRIAWIKEHGEARREPVLSEALSALDLSLLDLVIVEGFKNESFPKIELHRPALGHPLMCADDDSIVALATDASVSAAPEVRRLDINDAAEIAAFIIACLGLEREAPPVQEARGGQ